MLGQLARAGHEVVLDPEEADVLVVNTCAFVADAKQESIDAVLDAARMKAARAGRRLVVSGCLAQRYASELPDLLPEVDAFVGTGALGDITAAIAAQPAAGPSVYLGGPHVLPAHAASPRVRTGAWWTSYVKVSEGCDHTCSFCIIPKIRGRHESRGMDDVLAEAAALAADGVVELNLIAQDLTAYGRDLRDGSSLAVLLRALARRVPEVRWLRLLYAYPASVRDDLLEVMADEPAVCRYLDMPLQHIADDVLLAMRRERSGAAIRKLLRRIREAVPGIAIRSTLIVGFPGERERHVDELCAFLEEAELEHAGVFRYSREENTAAAALSGHVSEATKQARWERVMAVQAGVSARRMQAHVGRELDVLVEREEEALLVGRTAAQAPEIDGLIRLRGDAAPGDLVRARVTGATTYDLEGQILDTVDSDPRAHYMSAPSQPGARNP